MARPHTSSIVTIWCLGYLFTFGLLMLTAPVTGKDDGNWLGMLLAVCTLLYGAYRLSRGGARPGACFVYGCGAEFLFLLWSFYDVGGAYHFGMYLWYQKVTAEQLAVEWVGGALFLGTVCAAVGMIGYARFNDDSRDDHEQPENSDSAGQAVADTIEETMTRSV